MKRFPPDDGFEAELCRFYGYKPFSFIAFEHRQRIEKVAKYFRLVKPGTECLDMGCGAGAYTVLLAEKFKTVALDIDLVSLNSLRKWAKIRGVEKNLKVMEGNMNKMPFENSSFDFVLATESLEHLKEPSHGFRELNRVLKPGGKALVTMPNSLSIFWFFNHLAKNLKLYYCPPVKGGRDYHYELPYYKIERIISANELKVLKRESIMSVPFAVSYNLGLLKKISGMVMLAGSTVNKAEKLFSPLPFGASVLYYLQKEQA